VRLWSFYCAYQLGSATLCPGAASCGCGRDLLRHVRGNGTAGTSRTADEKGVTTLSRYYQNLDQAGGLDYELYRVSTIGREFRGPAIDTAAPYLAFLGSAHTFGRFVAAPFPSLLGQRLGIQVLNLAVGGAGPRHYLTREYLELLNGAEAVIIQVLSGRSASNSMFDNTQSGGLMGCVRGQASPIRAEEFFTQLGKSSDKSRFEEVINETRDDYMSSFVQLLRKIVVPRILFWFSTRTPHYEEDLANIPHGVLGAFPQLVNQRMMKELAAFSDAYVECVSKQGLPQTLWPSDQSIDGAGCRNGVLQNNYYPSPSMHVAAADGLEQACRRFSGRQRRPDTNCDAVVPFVMIAAARTGTNLLIGLLNDFAGCYVGGELFNPNLILRDSIPWRDVDDADMVNLLALRKSDPIAFWKALCTLSEKRGVRTIGFKLLYSHGLTHGGLLEWLAADKTIPVIHLTRRNLLRRLVSERQAQVLDVWAESATAPATPRPAIALSMNEIVASLETIEAQQVQYDAMFAEHPVLSLIYEDLAERPVRTAERVARFLGLSCQGKTPSVMYRKTGHERLSEAVLGYDALVAKMRRFCSLFDDKQ
jgi:LPS sulfotransferase NodH